MRFAYYIEQCCRAQAADGSDGRLRIGYERWTLSRVSPGWPLDSFASVVVVGCRGVAQPAAHDVRGAGHPGMCWTPAVTRPGG